jgi:cardiolipin synthase
MNSDITSTHENVILVHSGNDYFLRLEQIINESISELHIQTYIFDNDAIGTRIAEALKRAATRDVEIYILLDGFGSFSFPKEMIHDLRQSGINIRLFAPLFSASSFYLGRRLHHKVVVADAKIALIGGINIADKYLGTTTEAPWLDYAVQLDGAISAPLQQLCRDIYFKKRRVNRKKIAAVFHTQHKTIVRILQNDWLKRKNEICNAYIKSFRHAKKEIVIVGSYFLPGRRLTNALKKASRNNVQIKLILSGISDIALSRRATSYFYANLLDHNIELYEWNKSVLHGKATIVDGHWSTIGSFNLNNLSSYGSIEMNVEIDSVEFSSIYLSHLNQIIAQCQKITPESLQKKNTLSSKLMNWFSYWIARLILIIVTYFPYKRFKKLY